VRKEGVEVWFGAEVQDLRIVRVVDVCEDAQELAVNVLDYGGECWREIVACNGCDLVSDFFWMTMMGRT
jgi:hypothetical protein